MLNVSWPFPTMVKCSCKPNVARCHFSSAIMIIRWQMVLGRIVEVNGVNVNQENHKQVVARIKSIENETKLLGIVLFRNLTDAMQSTWFLVPKATLAITDRACQSEIISQPFRNYRHLGFFLLNYQTDILNKNPFSCWQNLRGLPQAEGHRGTEQSSICGSLLQHCDCSGGVEGN